MLKVYAKYDFDSLYNNSWGQAVKVLNEIDEADKSEDLMDFLEDLYPEGAEDVELNDLLAYDWEWVYSIIGMPSDDEEED